MRFAAPLLMVASAALAVVGGFLLYEHACSPTTYDHGVPNLHQVGPGLWRSGQPTTQEGWEYLRSLGVRHVVKLNFDAEGTDSLAVAAGLDVHSLPVQPEGDRDVFDEVANAFRQPAAREVDEAVRLLARAAPEDGWLVHCTHGHDRTGYVVGRHRVLHDGWDKARAYSEMVRLGFHPELLGLQRAWERFRP